MTCLLSLIGPDLGFRCRGDKARVVRQRTPTKLPHCSARNREAELALSDETADSLLNIDRHRERWALESGKAMAPPLVGLPGQLRDRNSWHAPRSGSWSLRGPRAGSGLPEPVGASIYRFASAAVTLAYPLSSRTLFPPENYIVSTPSHQLFFADVVKRSES